MDDDSETLYVLPKTYNGKTVTELFPEFKFNSVLRFSKLFGPINSRNLPKIWKSVKKRKKLTKQATNENQENNFIQNNDQPNKQEAPSVILNAPNIFDIENNDHIFEQDEEKSKQLLTIDELVIDYGRKANDNEADEDDEDDFLKPYKIEESDDDDRMDGRNGDGSTHKGDKKLSQHEQKELARLKSLNWKYGPASYWYNNSSNELNPNDYRFDYGFQKKQSKSGQDSMDIDPIDCLIIDEFNVSDEAYLLVNTTNWEDKVAFDANINDHKVDMLNERIKYAGWIPSQDHRTLASFQSKVYSKNVDYLNRIGEEEEPQQQQQQQQTGKGQKWLSIFPNENYELLYGDWEKNIIFDPENMEQLPSPPEYILDSNDENLILAIPDEPSEYNDEKQREEGGTSTGATGPDGVSTTKRKKHEIYENRAKMSKSLLGRSGVLKDDNHHDEKFEHNREPKDFWNLSNDDYYSVKATTESTTAKSATALVLQHSTVAVELRPPFFPTHLSTSKLRNFHRLPLKKYATGQLADLGFHSVCSLYDHIRDMAKQREQERTACGGGEMFYMRNPCDLSGKDGELILAEYSEQYPPLMMQIGMATKIKNYYKRKIGKDDGPPALEFGENVHGHSSPFLGNLTAGEYLQSFENYLFRSPIYLHTTEKCDFLVIRTKTSYYIREVNNVFVIGQECPLIEVPGPNSKRANGFIKDFLQVYIYRLFHRSKDNPKRIKMEDIRKAFPLHAESSIRKRLKLCADFKRTGLAKFSNGDANWWVLKDNFRLPSEEEIRAMVSPEQCCAYYSMLAAEQRLKDAGYGEKNLFAADDEDVDNIKIDDEVKNAPWHTTRAYLDATKGKCLLQVTGVADPTGRGEGYSYVRQAIKPKQEEEQQQKEQQQKELQQKEQEKSQGQSKRPVTGTDADLRKLHLKDARKLLLSYGVPDEEIKQLKRWEIIDVVRTMSTQKAREGSDFGVSKFARGNKLSQSDAHEKFREECQRIFELQNRNLSSKEVLSTDEDEDSNEDTDVDEMGKNLESMLQSKQIGMDESDKDKAFKKLFMPDKPLNTNTDSNSSEKLSEQKEKLKNEANKMNRILKITRTYRDEETGKEYTKVEIVRKPLVIDAYVKIRTTRDDDFIRQAFALDEEEKEQLRKERRRLQEQLRRVKRNEAAASRKQQHKESIIKDEDGDHTQSNDHEPIITTIPKEKIKTKIVSNVPKMPKKKYTKDGAEKPVKEKTVKCGACGAIGHSRSNRECPMYVPKDLNQSTASSTHHIEESIDSTMNENSQSSNLTKLQGTKLIINKSAITKKPRKNKAEAGAAGTTASASISLNMSDGAMEVSTSMASMDMSSDDHQTPTTSAGEDKKKLILTIPKQKIVNKHKTPNPKLNKLKQQLKKNAQKHQIGHQQSTPQLPLSQPQTPLIFPTNSQPPTPLSSFQQQSFFFQNQPQTPQLQSQFSKDSNKQRRKPSIQQHCDYLDKPHKKVDRRHADPLVSFASILESIYTELKESPNSQHFMFPVNAKAVPDYYKLIRNPIDLQIIKKRIQEKFYKNQESFLKDLKLLVDNSALYNGQNHLITQQANNLYFHCVKQFEEKKEKLTRLEKQINPLLDDNSLIVFNYLLEKIFEDNIMTIENSYSFHKPVNKAKYKDYYDVIKNPIDLERIKNRINAKKYRTRDQFLADFQLLHDNCLTYNGAQSSYTTTAGKILSACKAALESNAEKMAALEQEIEQSNYNSIRNSIEMTDSESNLATLSSFHDNESIDSGSGINMSTNFKSSMSHTLSTLSNKLLLAQQSLQQQNQYHSSDQEDFVDVEGIDEKTNVMDDLQISEDED